jgi:predicted aspartyl protease
VVDTGATRLVLPQKVVRRLGLRESGTIRVRYADGRRATRPTVRDVQVELRGRSEVFGATVEARRRTALIGAVVLEVLDFFVDPIHERLVPRDPTIIVSEEEYLEKPRSKAYNLSASSVRWSTTRSSASPPPSRVTSIRSGTSTNLQLSVRPVATLHTQESWVSIETTSFPTQRAST